MNGAVDPEAPSEPTVADPVEAVVAELMATGPRSKASRRRLFEVGGRRLRLRLEWRQYTPWLSVRVPADVAGAGLMVSVRRGGAPPLADHVVATGDAAFDRDFIVEAAPRDLALGFLDDSARREALALRLDTLRAESDAIVARFELPGGDDVPLERTAEHTRRAAALVARQAKRLPHLGREIGALTGAGHVGARAAEMALLRGARRKRTRRERLAARLAIVACVLALGALIARLAG
jgi:hypothetical protein